MDEVLERLRIELAGRYSVEHEVGRGGMAVVYLANDLRHDRRVAIKVLRPDLGFASAGDRFLREIRTAAQLNHAHILPLYDSGTAAGYLYYVMPYVEGETVRDRLARGGPLTVDEAVRITRDVADALEFAHARGVVHRDIKPENIFLSAGHAAVGDFGIASAADAAGIKVTETGVAVGTPAYMSPEQATAEPKVDGRSDQYSLACVLYEMLAGEPPFTGPTSRVVMARHAVDPVPPLTTVRAVPPALEAAVRKALAKAPADRWPTTRAFADALTAVAPLDAGDKRTLRSARRRWAVRAGVALAAAILISTAWLSRARASANRAAQAAPVRRVAVLPFENIGDSSQAYIADGLTEAVHSGLVRAEGLSVTSISRMSAYRDSLVDVREMGRKFGVHAIVTATVQQSGDRLRVTVHLVDVADGRDIWSDRYDGELRDVFSFQDSIAVKIVDALRPRLTATGRAVIPRGVRTRDPEAWKLYVQAGRVMFQMSKDSISHAKTLLERAIERDSSFSDAWALLVTALDLHSRFSSDPPEEFNVAMRRAANRAVELDSTSGPALGARGWTRALNDWDWDGALRDLRAAVRLSPGSREVSYPYLLLFLNQPDSALVHTRRWSDSTNAYWWNMLATTFKFAGHVDSATAAWERVVALDSNFSEAYFALATTYLTAGRRADADRAIKKYLAASGDDAQGIGWAAEYYRQARDTAGARRMLERLTAVKRHRTWGVHSGMSMVHLALGDRAAALDAVEAAAGAHEYLLPATAAYGLVPLRGEPRFEAVRRRVFGSRPLPTYAW